MRIDNDNDLSEIDARDRYVDVDVDVERSGSGLKPSGTALAFIALSIGIMLSWALTRLNVRLDQRVVLMIVGILSGTMFDTDNLLSKSRSEFMHLLGPALSLAGQLEMNTKMLSEMAGKFMVYSLVGMCLCAFANAGLISVLVHSASDMTIFHLLGLGAILSHPNFTATSQILKQFRVSSRLRISITGEKMFNGIALTLLKNMGDSEGKQHWLDMLMESLRETFGGYAIGVGLGIFTLWGLEVASRKHSDIDRSLQVVLTLFCAYGAYHASKFILMCGDGDAATLAAAWILSWRMWAVLVAPEEMRNFWGVLDYGSDTFNAFVQGAVLSATFRSSFSNIHGASVILRIVGLWLMVTLARLVVFFLLTPLSNGLGRPLSWREKALWAWAGTVKGKLGITITMYRAIQNFNVGDEGQRAYNRSLLLYGGGVTFLSLLLNTTLTPLVVTLLKLDGRNRPESKLKTELGKRILRHKVLDELGAETGPFLLKRKCPETWQFLQATSNADELLDTVDASFYISMTREVFLELSKRNYQRMSEGKSRRVIRLVAATLMESIIFGKDHCNRGLTDWEYVKDSLPELMSEIVFIIHSYLSTQRLSQGQFEDTALLKQTCLGKEDFFSRGIALAWEIVRKESNRNCRAARKLLSKLDLNEVRLSVERQAAWEVCDVLEDHGGHLGGIGLFDDTGGLFGALLADSRSLDRVRSGESKNIDIMEKVNESDDEFEDIAWDFNSVQTLEELRTFVMRKTSEQTSKKLD